MRLLIGVGHVIGLRTMFGNVIESVVALLCCIIVQQGLILASNVALQVGAQGNELCSRSLVELNTNCGVESIDQLRSMSFLELGDCCAIADQILEFGCVDPCEELLETDNDNNDTSLYPLWRALCNHPSTPCMDPPMAPLLQTKIDDVGQDTLILSSNDNDVIIDNATTATNNNNNVSVQETQSSQYYEGSSTYVIQTDDMAELFQQQLEDAVTTLNETKQEATDVGNSTLEQTKLQRLPESALDTSSTDDPIPPSAEEISQDIFAKMSADPQLSTSANLFSSSPLLFQHIQGGSSLTLLTPSDSAWLIFAINVGLSLPQDLQRFEYIEQVLTNHIIWGKHKLSSVKESDKVRLLTLKQDVVLRVFWSQEGVLLVEGCCEDGNIARVEGADEYENEKLQVHVIDDVLLPPFAFVNRSEFFGESFEELVDGEQLQEQENVVQQGSVTNGNILSNLSPGAASPQKAATYGEELHQEQVVLQTSQEQQSTIQQQSSSSSFILYEQQQYQISQNLSSNLVSNYDEVDDQTGYSNSGDGMENQDNGVAEDVTDGTPDDECKPVSEVLQEQVYLGSLFTILQHSELLQVVDSISQSYGDFTLLAPTNEAFGIFLSTYPTYEQQLVDKTQVELLLSYLVLPQPVSKDITQIQRRQTLYFDTVLKAENDTLQLSFRKFSNITVVEGISGSATLTGDTVQACNSTLLFMDTLILPFQLRSQAGG